MTTNALVREIKGMLASYKGAGPPIIYVGGRFMKVNKIKTIDVMKALNIPSMTTLIPGVSLDEYGLYVRERGKYIRVDDLNKLKLPKED